MMVHEFDKKDRRFKILMDLLLEAIDKSEKRPITYKKGVTDKAARINSKYAKTMHYRFRVGNLLGCMNEKIANDVGNDAPTISALVVNARTKLPGGGIEHYKGFYGWNGLDPKEKLKRTKRVQKQVFEYPYWRKIYKKLFGVAAPRAKKKAS